MKESIKNEVPIWEKYSLTIDEAVEYFNIGHCKLRELLDKPDCKFVLYVGSKKLIKRVMFEQFLDNQNSL